MIELADTQGSLGGPVANVNRRTRAQWDAIKADLTAQIAAEERLIAETRTTAPGAGIHPFHVSQSDDGKAKVELVYTEIEGLPPNQLMALERIDTNGNGAIEVDEMIEVETENRSLAQQAAT